MGEISRDSKDIHDGVFFFLYIYYLLISPPLDNPRMKQRFRGVYVSVPAYTSLSLGSLAMEVGSLLRLGEKLRG